MSAKPLDQPAITPEKALDQSKPTDDKALSSVDRVELLKQYQPSDPGKLPASVPSLTLDGWQKFQIAQPAEFKAQDQTALNGDKTKVSDQKPAELTKEQRIDSAKKTLESSDATIKQKMEAMSSLYNDSEKGKDGRAHITLNDGGKERSFDISATGAGKDVTLLQLSAKDAHGKSHPVLRAVERNGEIEQQRNKNGSKADFRGDWWTANAKDSNVAKIGQGADKPDVKPTDVKPADVKPGVSPTDTIPVPEKSPTREIKPLPDTSLPDAKLPDNVPIPRHRPEHNPQPEAEHRKHRDPVVVPWKNKDRADTPSESDGKDTTTRPGNIRSASEISKFYTHQDDGNSCSAFAVGMAKADHRLGRPIHYGRESQALKELTGTTNHGYRGSLETLEGQMQRTGLEAKAYDYGMGQVGQQAMRDLNRELDQGHSAVAKVINPHTGNPHYIYIAGRDANGQYILGDPDRKNTQHFKPVSQAYLQRMMSRRDGFVATW